MQGTGEWREVAPGCLLVALGCVLRAYSSGLLKSVSRRPCGPLEILLNPSFKGGEFHPLILEKGVKTTRFWEPL